MGLTVLDNVDNVDNDVVVDDVVADDGLMTMLFNDSVN